LANNELDGNLIAGGIVKYLKQNRNLLDLNLSNNRIGD
jgi:hypothetical protein